MPVQHGHASRTDRSPEYRCWAHLIYRCENPKAREYHNYGGRGIGVCERWRQSFEIFLADMGPRPSLRHTIDRIDNNGDYKPGNCRWATGKEQGANRRDVRLMSHAGETLPMSTWATRAAVAPTTFIHRINSGWTIERALTEPAQNNGGRKPKERAA